MKSENKKVMFAILGCAAFVTIFLCCLCVGSVLFFRSIPASSSPVDVDDKTGGNPAPTPNPAPVAVPTPNPTPAKINPANLKITGIPLMDSPSFAKNPCKVTDTITGKSYATCYYEDSTNPEKAGMIKLDVYAVLFAGGVVGDEKQFISMGGDGGDVMLNVYGVNLTTGRFRVIERKYFSLTGAAKAEIDDYYATIKKYNVDYYRVLVGYKPGVKCDYPNSYDSECILPVQVKDTAACKDITKPAAYELSCFTNLSQLHQEARASLVQAMATAKSRL